MLGTGSIVNSSRSRAPLQAPEGMVPTDSADGDSLTWLMHYLNSQMYVDEWSCRLCLVVLGCYIHTFGVQAGFLMALSREEGSAGSRREPQRGGGRCCGIEQP